MDGGSERDMSHQLDDVVSAHRYSVWLDPRDGGIPHCVLVGFTHKTLSFHLLENFNHRPRQFAKCIDHGGAGLAQRFHFASMGAASTFNDRASMTEPRAFPRRLPANVCDHLLCDFLLVNSLRPFLFLRRTNFAKDDDSFVERIGFKPQCRMGNTNSKTGVPANVRASS